MSFFLSTFFEDIAPGKKLTANRIPVDRFYRAAHDLRSPLSALNLAIHHFKSLSPHLKHLEILDETVRRINRIAEDILQMRPRPSPAVKSFELKTSLECFFCEAQLHLTKGGLELSQSLDLLKDPVQIRGENDDFLRILWNLVQNAIDAGASKICISCQQKNSDSVVLVLEDNGHGIPEDVLQRIGEEGFTTKKSGHGLGIYTTIQKLRTWNGDLKLQSIQGQGSRLEMNLSYF